LSIQILNDSPKAMFRPDLFEKIQEKYPDLIKQTYDSWIRNHPDIFLIYEGGGKNQSQVTLVTKTNVQFQKTPVENVTDKVITEMMLCKDYTVEQDYILKKYNTGEIAYSTLFNIIRDTKLFTKFQGQDGKWYIKLTQPTVAK